MKKIILGLLALGVAVAVMPLFAAFEAHVVNVTATIENALSVPISSIQYGTVFPQEHLERPLRVLLSSSFLSEQRVDNVEYFIRFAVSFSHIKRRTFQPMTSPSIS